MSDQAEKCPHCGYEFKADKSTLTIYCKTSFSNLMSNKVPFYINDEIVKIPINDDNGTTVTLNPSTTKLSYRGLRFVKDNRTFEVKEKENYTCNIDFHPFLFDASFVVTDSKGNTVLQKKKSLRNFLLFMIMLIAVIILINSFGK